MDGTNLVLFSQLVEAVSTLLSPVPCQVARPPSLHAPCLTSRTCLPRDASPEIKSVVELEERLLPVTETKNMLINNVIRTISI